ncbi:hypothetical protein Nepgr_020443 [Nepenthes gracilis]|uniref:Uncharacterized protein n=1 Tax=Nepenthes gracilis TaxID=150966 RepID=A0AAD3SY32_NEPGR|nr:hypothetical protein Nepgr_020443 [Nepenthes gracilis]
MRALGFDKCHPLALSASPRSPPTGPGDQCRSLLRSVSLDVLKLEPSFVAIPSVPAIGSIFLDVIPDEVQESPAIAPVVGVGPNGVQKEIVSSTHSSHATQDALQGTDQDRAQLVMGNPICDMDQIDGFQDSCPSFVECLANGVDLDLTPCSITRLSSKYSLDDSIHVELASVSPRGTVDGG